MCSALPTQSHKIQLYTESTVNYPPATHFNIFQQKSSVPQKVQRTTHRHLTSFYSRPCAVHYPHKPIKSRFTQKCSKLPTGNLLRYFPTEIQRSTESAVTYPLAPHFSPFQAMCSALPAHTHEIQLYTESAVNYSQGSVQIVLSLFHHEIIRPRCSLWSNLSAAPSTCGP